MLHRKIYLIGVLCTLAAYGYVIADNLSRPAAAAPCPAGSCEEGAARQCEAADCSAAEASAASEERPVKE